MRKAILGLCVLVIGFGEVKAQWVTIPDPNFANYLQSYYGSCMSGNQLNVGCSEVLSATTLDCSNNYITDLEGIQYFTSLTDLNCSFNQLTSLPSLPSSLSSLRCQDNLLTALPDLPFSLSQLGCGGNQITVLPSLPSSLGLLDCTGNPLTQLPGLPPSLYMLNIQGCDVTSLPTLPDGLSTLVVNGNELTELPPLPPNLTQLLCEQNHLDSLPALPESLRALYCDENNLSTLPPLPAGLDALYCGTNHISYLEPLPVGLTIFECGYNPMPVLPILHNNIKRLDLHHLQLTYLPAPLPDSLWYLDCSYNPLTFLPALPKTIDGLFCTHTNLTELVELPESLNWLDISYNPSLRCFPVLKRFRGGNNNWRSEETGIKCLPNIILHSGSIPAIDTLPVCDLFNSTGCNMAWNIQGSIYRDENGDCVRQASESKVFPVKVNLYHAGVLVESIYSSNGYYSFDAGFATYKVSIDTAGIPFTFSCPGTGDTVISISGLDSLQNIDFALKCAPGFDLNVASIAGNRFRPAWEETIYIKAGDVASDFGAYCANSISGNVVVTITGPAKYISAAPGALTPDDVTDSVIIWNVPDFGLVNSAKDFNIVVQVDTFAQAYEQICFDAFVTPTAGDNNATNNSLQQCFEVKTSFDPNDKLVFPNGNVDTAQQWLTYTIRFQNTGNDTAIHIQIIDTLDSYLDISSFKLLDYSHANITQVLPGGIVKFTFPNIYLPDSNVNEPLSHGYVQYQVKVRENMSSGTAVQNKAYIYFDFNAPVPTNTTVSRFCTPQTTHLTGYLCGGSPGFMFNDTLRTEIGIYSARFISTNGCDSVYTLNLTAESNDVSIEQLAADTLRVSGGGTIVWINCNNGYVLPNQTNRIFSTTVFGNYAAVFSLGDCKDTTECITAGFTDINETTAPAVFIYPNPAIDKVQIMISGAKDDLKMTVFNSIDELVQSLKIGSHYEMDVSNLPNGVYHVCIITPEGLFSSKRLIVGK